MSDLIRRSDAIEAVVCHIWHMPNEAYRLFNCENVVLDVVEDAIRRLPSAKEDDVRSILSDDHYGCSDCRYESKDEHEYPCCECSGNYTDKYEPKGDEVKVIRCKYCLWYHKGQNESESWERCSLHKHGTSEDMHCAWAERR